MEMETPSRKPWHSHEGSREDYSGVRYAVNASEVALRTDFTACICNLCAFHIDSNLKIALGQIPE
jgi:hypothetical protein